MNWHRRPWVPRWPALGACFTGWTNLKRHVGYAIPKGINTNNKECLKGVSWILSERHSTCCLPKRWCTTIYTFLHCSSKMNHQPHPNLNTFNRDPLGIHIMSRAPFIPNNTPTLNHRGNSKSTGNKPFKAISTEP